jgi:hypothetical protein
MSNGEEQEEKPRFKVVDRRRFTDAGDRREGVEDRVESVEAKKAEPPVPGQKAPPPSAPQSAPEPKKEAQSSAPRPSGLTFALFVQSLAQQSLMALGMMPWPDTGLVEPRPDQARETIDLLDILAEKTQGNLSPEEEQILGGVLPELKMAYLQISQGPPPGATGA